MIHVFLKKRGNDTRDQFGSWVFGEKSNIILGKGEEYVYGKDCASKEEALKEMEKIDWRVIPAMKEVLY